jgi:glycosyltransferase involved in cell wall biosynthesis
MRILIFHNQLWAHYKSKLFSEIHEVLKRESADNELKVCHIAEYESMRHSMMDLKKITYDYPYEVLFEGSLDQIGFFSRLRGLWRSFHQFKPDVLNITGYFDYAQVIMMVYARWFYGIPVVLSSESSIADRKRSSLKEFVKSLIVRQANAFFCFGKTSAQYLLDLGVHTSKIAVSNAAVVDDETIYKQFEEAKSENDLRNPHTNFIYVGRLAEEKNLDLLLKAFKVIKQNNPKAHGWGLTLVGDGPEMNHLKTLTANLQIEDVAFMGGFPWYEVPRYFASSSVAVLPSLSEPWGLVVNEAMICNLPVIVSDRCGCAPDLVAHGENGFIFDPEDEAGLTAHLSFFINNPDQIQPMGVRSAQIVRRFSVGQVAQKMVECYQKLCQKV